LIFAPYFFVHIRGTGSSCATDPSDARPHLARVP
jgi:hypothetical protein